VRRDDGLVVSYAVKDPQRLVAHLLLVKQPHATTPWIERQVSGELSGTRHPHEAARLPDAQLIGVALSHVPWGLDQIRVHGVALTARVGPPSRSGALVEPKSRYYRVHGTPMARKVTTMTTVSTEGRSR
jgi:hypothetical protein